MRTINYLKQKTGVTDLVWETNQFLKWTSLVKININDGRNYSFILVIIRFVYK